MKILETYLDNINPQTDYLCTSLNTELNKLLFFDIETTGFSAKTSSLYLIGICRYTKQRWCLEQYLSENPNEEKELIELFFHILEQYKVLIHFNGSGFDIPYLYKKCRQYQIVSTTLEQIQSFDIYKQIAPYRKIFPIEHLKQKSIEEFLEISRTDEIDGGTLISYYQEYQKTKEKETESLLFLHNHDDLTGMLQILPILYYVDIFQGNYQDYDAEFHSYRLPDHTEAYEYNIRLYYENPFSIPFTFRRQEVFFKFSGNILYISVKGCFGELKYFFKDYKNYYYLPLEDMAVHKSVASYVDKKYRKPAAAADCYLKKEGIFFPAYTAECKEIFQKDIKSTQKYICYSEAQWQNKNFVHSYIQALLKLL